MISPEYILSRTRYHHSNSDQFVFAVPPTTLKPIKALIFIAHCDIVVNKYTLFTFISEDTLKLLFLVEATKEAQFLNAHLGPAGVQRAHFIVHSRPKKKPSPSRRPLRSTEQRDEDDLGREMVKNARINIGAGTVFSLRLRSSTTLTFDWGTKRVVGRRPVQATDYIVMHFVEQQVDEIISMQFSQQEISVAAVRGTIYPAISLCTMPLPGMQVLGRVVEVVSPEQCLVHAQLSMGNLVDESAERCVIRDVV